ncbi:hypothetical protein [Polyangium aurulentum]|uniref:hypothetical protein n=1 Tax=Polyangium aurulentum TaxID=2567896 RepID=UPI0010ADF55B|nr:hypothetical protein [Polyangium aurulentum]UQA56862.1 hypothetical protein E8A73_037025 [Polyangium aurulentum]
MMPFSSHASVRRLATSTLVVVSLGGVTLHCGPPDPPDPPPPSPQTSCSGTFSDGTKIDVARPQPLVDVPGDQSFCDFHTFAWNEFLYLVQTVSDPNDPSFPSKPRFLSYAPSYNMLRPDDSLPPGAFPGGNTTLDVKRLDRKQAGNGGDELIDVAGQTVLYDMRFNEAMYDFIVGKGYFTQKGYDDFCKPETTEPFSPCKNTEQIWLPGRGEGKTVLGSIEVKTAWRQFPEGDCPSTQMYCAGTKLGMVALHIAQKTPTHGEWIWASFEHIANAPDCTAGSSTPIAQQSPLGTPWSFFDPAKAPASVMETKTCGVTADNAQCNLDPHDPLDKETFRQVNICRTDVLPAGGASAANCEISRQGPLANSAGNTECLNATLRPHLEGVWQNYQLVGTLWTQGEQAPDKDFSIAVFQEPKPNVPEKTAVGFPNLANTALETFLQTGSTAYDPNGSSLSNANKSGCFGCHNTAPHNTDTDLSHFPSKFYAPEMP